jgi:hypothetical protein
MRRDGGLFFLLPLCQDFLQDFVCMLADFHPGIRQVLVLFDGDAYGQIIAI